MSLLSCQRQKGEGNGVAGTDSTLSLSYIQQVYDKDPARALLLADSAEQHSRQDDDQDHSSGLFHAATSL